MSLKMLTKKRYPEIDFLRGSAIFFMLIVHINVIFSAGDSFVLDRLTWFGATICFSAFLFCFAFVYGQKLSNHKKLNLKKEIKRFFNLLLVYYLSAIMADYFISNEFTLEKLYLILTLQYLPIFTEFIIPFFLYIILILIFSGVFKKMLRYPVLFFLISFTVFAFAKWLYPVSSGEGFLNIVKTLFVGNGHVHSFGVLAYFPVFVFGLILGALQDKKHGQPDIQTVFFISLILLIFLKISGYSLWYRFPPSILFLLYGIIYSFGVLWLYRYLKKINLLNKYFIFLGKKALFIFLISVLVILGLANVLNYEKFGYQTVWLLQFLIITGISLLSLFYGKLAELWTKNKI